MERPTHELKTGGGHVVVLNDYITGAEHRRIRAHYGAALRKPEAERDETQIDFEGDNLAFEIAVVSLDGSSENIVSRILDLPLPDFKEIVSEVKELTQGKKK